MAAIAILGLLFAWIRSVGSFSYALVVVAHSRVAWGFCLVVGIAIAWAFAPVIHKHRARTRVAIKIGLAVVFATVSYLAWAQYRVGRPFDLDPEHGLLYPDRQIIALNSWLDARRPVSPGSFKLHSEFPTVAFILGTMVVGGMTLAGLLLGLLSKRGRPLAEDPGDRRD